MRSILHIEYEASGFSRQDPRIPRRIVLVRRPALEIMRDIITFSPNASITDGYASSQGTLSWLRSSDKLAGFSSQCLRQAFLHLICKTAAPAFVRHHAPLGMRALSRCSYSVHAIYMEDSVARGQLHGYRRISDGGGNRDKGGSVATMPRPSRH